MDSRQMGGFFRLREDFVSALCLSAHSALCQFRFWEIIPFLHTTVIKGVERENLCEREVRPGAALLIVLTAHDGEHIIHILALLVSILGYIGILYNFI